MKNASSLRKVCGRNRLQGPRKGIHVTTKHHTPSSERDVSDKLPLWLLSAGCTNNVDVGCERLFKMHAARALDT